jgi:dihydropteroate synthase
MLWQCRDQTIGLSRTRIMGVVNTTPDSFSDGGEFLDAAAGIAHALRLLEEGADLLDLGGESSRPGALPVGAGEESRRVLPVLVGLLDVRPDACVSIDTTKADVAREALAAGARVVNDISAGRADPDMFRVVADHGAGLVLMHMRGEPRSMQADPRYADVVGEVCDFLSARLEAAIASGIAAERIVLDPGIGFGKTLEHNLALVAGLPRLAALGRPILVGLSRKRMLGEITGRGVGDRLAASLGGLAACIERGAKILRVHDAKQSCDVARVIDRVRNTGAVARPPSHP